MSRIKFMPQGDFSVATENQILVASITGPWNEELAYLFGRKANECADLLSGTRWALLATIFNDGMHTPDTFDATVQMVRQHRQKGRAATALVLKDISGPEIVRRVFSRIYEKAGETYAFFDDEASARCWLEDRLGETVAQ
ncbi:MAG: hypothetical protein H6R18_2734 [Proteobacteria bacterium]|nr:hypothetical protein [Pseudomonadota bacterium]